MSEPCSFIIYSHGVATDTSICHKATKAFYRNNRLLFEMHCFSHPQHHYEFKIKGQKRQMFCTFCWFVTTHLLTWASLHGPVAKLIYTAVLVVLPSNTGLANQYERKLASWEVAILIPQEELDRAELFSPVCLVLPLASWWLRHQARSGDWVGIHKPGLPLRSWGPMRALSPSPGHWLATSGT